jgi:hypothetical protein
VVLHRGPCLVFVQWPCGSASRSVHGTCSVAVS